MTMATCQCPASSETKRYPLFPVYDFGVLVCPYTRTLALVMIAVSVYAPGKIKYT